MDKVTLTTFTDPMMGLSYECEPLFRKLETHFAGQIDFQYSMCVLVRNVHDFMIPSDYADNEEASIANYNARLATIYKNEEDISGMPIVMDGFHLFDTEHQTSKPLCLAYKAVQHVAPERAQSFLYRLRYATIVETRPTTHREELLRVCRLTGIDEDAFLICLDSGIAETALEHDQLIAQSLHLSSLPAYLLSYGRKRLLIRRLAGYDFFTSAIRQLTEGRIVPTSIEPSDNALRQFFRLHPLVSPIEICQAFDLRHPDEVSPLIQPLIDDGSITLFRVSHGLFIKSNN